MKRLTAIAAATGLILLALPTGSAAHPRVASAASAELSLQDQALVRQLWPTHAPLVLVNNGETRSVPFSNAGLVASLLANPSTSSALREALRLIPVGERVSLSFRSAAAPPNASVLLNTASGQRVSPNSRPAVAFSAAGGQWYTATGSCHAYTNGGSDSFGEKITQLFYGDGHNVTNVQGAMESHNIFVPGWSFANGSYVNSSVPFHFVTSTNQMIWNYTTFLWWLNANWTVYINFTLLPAGGVEHSVQGCS